jgi:hypothetical protein
VANELKTVETEEQGGTSSAPDELTLVSEPGGTCVETNRCIEVIPISMLTPHPRNPRTHTRKQIRQIAKSIKRLGFCNPVLIDDNNQIIAGHGRVEAAKLLELLRVPALRLSHMSEDDVRAYIIADNKLAEQGGWDREILAAELEYLVDLKFDVEVIGFSVGEVDLTLEAADDARREAAGPEDKIPEPLQSEPVSRPGDLWVLDRHRILCGDARDGDSFARLLGGEKAEFVFSDPPYNVRVDGNVCGKGSIRHREFAMASGEMSSEAFSAFLGSVFGLLVEHSTDGSIHEIFMDWRHIGEMMAAGKSTYSELKNLCVWAKKNAGMGSFYRSRHELVFIWKAGTAPHVNTFELGQHGRHRTNVWEYASITGMGAAGREQLAMHPTVKPVALVADAIRDCSRRGGIVLDPFLGSGTALIAAERTGRRARGMEIDPVYVDVAIRRWQAYSGKVGTLAETGQSFEEVQEQRSTAVIQASIEPDPAARAKAA